MTGDEGRPIDRAYLLMCAEVEMIEFAAEILGEYVIAIKQSPPSGSIEERVWAEHLLDLDDAYAALRAFSPRAWWDPDSRPVLQ